MNRSTVNFADRLMTAVDAKKSALVVGLDPDCSLLPPALLARAKERYGSGEHGLAWAVTEFNRSIIDTVADLIPAVKPQLAYYEALGPAGLSAFRATVKAARSRGLLVIADAKRADIGATTSAYARAFFGRSPGAPEPAWTCDALTVQPYLGRDGLAPFLDWCAYGKGLFVLVRTSNAGAGELQDLRVNPADGKPLRSLAEAVGEAVAGWGKEFLGSSGYSAVGAVVGATNAQAAADLRRRMPATPFLVPGFGAQGGGAADVAPSFDSTGLGAVVNSSRGIIFAYRSDKGGDPSGAGFALAARVACEAAVKEINQVREQL